jgi:HD superfamily phosphohydrolase
MSNRTHEFRDPIHSFIKLDTEERALVNSRPFQRLRYIHQLALSYLVYPGATHRRFEHSLGVMDVSSRIYDVVTDPENLYHDSIRELVPRRSSTYEWSYWRRVLRMAALCHDTGHLPFSHAAEAALLPNGTHHEHLSKYIILSDEMKPVFSQLKIKPEDVAKIAVGPKYCEENFSDWESILYEMIGGNVFGADRIDFLLRDSYHSGVAYGRFDHNRLIETMRILPREDQETQEPELGITRGGLQAAESLLWARYFIYTQLYFHPIRRIYDIHLKEFLEKWLDWGHFSTDLEHHLRMTDNEVMSAINLASVTAASSAHDAACRITERNHFRVLYEVNPNDQKINLSSVQLVFEAAKQEFGDEAVRRDSYASPPASEDFPVRLRDGMIASSLTMSKTFSDGQGPAFQVDSVFVSPDGKEKAKKWLDAKKSIIIGEGA